MTNHFETIFIGRLKVSQYGTWLVAGCSPEFVSKSFQNMVKIGKLDITPKTTGMKSSSGFFEVIIFWYNNYKFYVTIILVPKV